MSEPVVRKQGFETDGPVEVVVAVGAGRVEVRLVEESGVDVEVRHSPEEANPWLEGVAGLVSWFSEQMGEQRPVDLPEEAVRQTRVEHGAGRVSVRAAKGVHLRNVPLAVVVRAPAGSSLNIRAGSAPVTVTGRAERVTVDTGAGEVNVEQATGASRVTTGTGAIRLGPFPAGAHLRSGSGDVEIAELGGPSTVATSSGDIWLGVVVGDVLVRTGTGDITIADGASGEVSLTTGSGALRVAVRQGSPAEIDLSSGAGEARSELPLSTSRPETKPALRVSGRTGSGSALVTLAKRT